MAKRGRKAVITYDMWLEASLEIATVDNLPIAKKLGVSRPTVYRMRKEIEDNDELREKYYNVALKNIEELAKAEYTRDLDNYDVFYELPIIKEWRRIFGIRRVTSKMIGLRLRSFWHICKHLRVHPNKITAEECAVLNIEMRELYLEGIEQPRGLAYSQIREAIRSFFMLVKNVSGDYLSNLGVTKEELLGAGRFAKQRVNPEIRKRFRETLKKYATDYNVYLEALNCALFQYATATRISATLRFNFDENSYDLQKDVWMFEVLDKGEKGGIKWEKYLIGHILEEFKDYCSKRFKIPIEDLEMELPKKTKYLFPTFINDKRTLHTNKLCKLFKNALIDAGLSYKIFPPTHIWRHTFAQDFLEASNWNYELCASLGGWKSTHILKKHYGQIGKKALMDGLKKSMGIDVIEGETKELRW